jgi:hypothetical protein
MSLKLEQNTHQARIRKRLVSSDALVWQMGQIKTRTEDSVTAPEQERSRLEVERAVKTSEQLGV